MKTFKVMTAMLVAVVSLCLVPSSCSRDKDEPAPAVAAKSIAGSYKGSLKSVVMGTETTFDNVAVTLAAPDDATVDVAIGTFGTPPMAVPAFAVKGVKVTGANGTYTLATTEFSGTSTTGRNYSGTLQGSFAQDKLTVQFNLKYGAMPMPMVCTFTAPREK